MSKEILTSILKNKDYGSLNLGKNKKILVEHTSINPNASPHVGRARNALIGDSIVHTLKFYGYNVETHYYVNDIGKQIALLIYAVQKHKVKGLTFDKMLYLYVKAKT